jgi:cytochrome P450
MTFHNFGNGDKLFEMPNLARIETERITAWFAWCRERLSLGPYSLEAGTLVLASTHRMGRDPALFPDPLTVKPERWLRTAEMTPRKENIANYFIL